MLTLFEGECKITNRQVLGFLPVLHSDDKDDNIFEQERGFSDVSKNYVTEYCTKKDKNGLSFYLSFMICPEFLRCCKLMHLKNSLFKTTGELKCREI